MRVEARTYVIILCRAAVRGSRDEADCLLFRVDGRRTWGRNGGRTDAAAAAGGAVRFLKEEADEVVTLYRHPEGAPFAVASSYQEWHDLSDEEVKDLLRSLDD